MKITTRYSDGQYTMRPARDGDAHVVEISDLEWRRYQRFCDADARWHRRIRDLDNAYYEKANTPWAIEAYIKEHGR